MKKTTRTLGLLLSALFIFALAGCAAQSAPEQTTAPSPPSPPQTEAPEAETGTEEPAAPEASTSTDEPSAEATSGEKPQVEITMEDGGVILLELDPEAAPLSVENFVNLVTEGFYDGLTFHRIIPGFMIQGGDPSGTGMGGPDHSIKGEFASNGWENAISHERGVISMARSAEPDSAGSQFFITHGDSQFLDGEYAAFGHVLEGMDVVDEIVSVETDGQDYPLEDVVIKSIRVV